MAAFSPRRFVDRVMRAVKDEDPEKLEDLRREAMEHEPVAEHPHEDTDDKGIHVHVHNHRRAADQDLAEERERELGGMDRHRSRDADPEAPPPETEEEPKLGEGGDPLEMIAQDLAEIKETLAELADAEAEEVDLAGEEEENPEAETADRRLHLRDRRTRIRDRIRGWRRRTDDENTTIVSTPKDPDADGHQPEGAGPGPDKIEGATPAKLGTGDRRRRPTRDQIMRDSTGLDAAFAAVVAKAEIMAPGMRMPTFDAKIPAQSTQERLCSLRRRTLDAAYRSEEGASAIDEVLGGRVLNLRDAPCVEVTKTFDAAAAVMAARNRRTAAGPGRATLDSGEKTMPEQIADYNKRMNDKFNPWPTRH
jgi:hypothetical protein